MPLFVIYEQEDYAYPKSAVLLPMNNMKSKKQIFITGMNGSGTTMLLDSFSRNRRVYAFPYESRIIPYLIARSRTLDLNIDENFRRLFAVALKHPIIMRANGGRRVAFDEAWLALDRTVGSLIDTLFMVFAQRQNQSIWCEKSPQNIQAVGEILSIFPDAVIIHMVRDGRDCAASLNRRWHRHSRLIIERWKRVVRAGERACRQHPANCIRIRYEDFTADPQRQLPALCERIGIPFEAAMLASAMPWVETQGKEKTIRFMGHKWPRYFNAGEISALEGIAGETLYQQGYAVTLRGDADLDPRLRQVMRVFDYAKAYARELLNKLTGRNDKPLKTLLSMPIVSLYEFMVKKY